LQCELVERDMPMHPITAPAAPPPVRPAVRDGALLVLLLLLGASAGSSAADRDRPLPRRLAPPHAPAAGLARAAFGVG
jgi:hypothetical protein